jgi:hypothetical protein
MQDYQFHNVREDAILTTSYVAGTVIENIQLQNQLIVYVDFTKGSLTTAEIKIEFSHDGTDYYQETSDGSPSSGVIDEAVFERSFEATGKFVIERPLKAGYVKISAKGTGTVTGSTMKINAITGVV